MLRKREGQNWYLNIIWCKKKLLPLRKASLPRSTEYQDDETQHRQFSSQVATLMFWQKSILKRAHCASTWFCNFTQIFSICHIYYPLPFLCSNYKDHSIWSLIASLILNQCQKHLHSIEWRICFSPSLALSLYHCGVKIGPEKSDEMCLLTLKCEQNSPQGTQSQICKKDQISFLHVEFWLIMEYYTRQSCFL